VNTQLHNYQILQQIGAGSFATVYVAEQRSLKRRIALKLLHAAKAQNPEDIARFQREAESMASLHHPNIVPIFDFGYTAQGYFLAMQLIEGMNLQQLLDTNSIDQPLSAYLLHSIASGLEMAHRRGITHRDVKPANILLSNDGDVKIADFGLAKLNQESAGHLSQATAVGTVCYMAPEVLLSPESVDTKADIYSFGCIGYLLYSGRLPFVGAHIAEISMGILNNPPPDFQAPEPAVKKLINACLEKSPKDRPTAIELVDQLERFVSARHARDQLKKQLGHCQPDSLGNEHAPLQSQTHSSPQQTATSASTAARQQLRWYKRPLSLGAIALIVTLGVVLLMLQTGPDDPKTYLPDFAVSTIPSAAPPSTAAQAPGLSAQGPAPLHTQSDTEAQARVQLRGFRPADIVVINGTDSVVISDDFTGFILLSSGSYNLQLFRKQQRISKKTISLMPYQKVIWEVYK